MSHTEVYLIRHAAPDWARTDIPYHLPPGPPLTAQGEAEARALGHFLRGLALPRLYCSPLERTRRTAEIAGGAAGLHYQVLDELIEWQPGEETDAVGRRMETALQQALSAGGNGRPAALITHGGPVGALLLRLGMPEPVLENWRKFDRRNPLPTAGAWRAVRPGQDAPWQFELVFTPEVVLS